MEKGLITYLLPLFLSIFGINKNALQNVDYQHLTNSSSRKEVDTQRRTDSSFIVHHSSLKTACQKTIHYTVETTTTKRSFTASEKLYAPPTLSAPLSIEADTALLSICIAHGGDCTWEINSKNKAKLSPIGTYTVTMLRQMSGDWTASPEQFLIDKQKAGGTTTLLAKGIVSLRQIDTASGYSSVTLIDTGHCIFLGSSFYNPDNSLKFKIVFKYGTNTEGWQRLESATLSALTLTENTNKGVFTEVTSTFKML